MSAPGDGLPADLHAYVGVDDDAPSLAFLARHPSLLGDLRRSPPEPVDETGETFCGFELSGRIAHGGCATVYEAQDGAGNRVALKLSWPADPDGAALLRREFAVVRRMRHPAVVRAHELLDDGERVAVVFERLPGPALCETSRHQVAVETALQWFRTLADALEHVHGRGVVHRDVKPGNLVLGADGAPRLLDFGLAADDDGVVGLRELAGTLPYMSPEQALGGLAAVGPRSDVYSLAVTFHELLTGRRVAEQAGRSHVLETVAFEPVVAPSRLRPDLPRVLDTVFARALHKDPQRRYANAAALRDDLDAVLHGSALPHARAPAPVRMARWLLRHRLLAVAAGVALAALLGTTVVRAWRGAERRAQAMQQLRAATAARSSYRDLLERLTAASDAGCEPARLRAFLLEQRSDLARAGTQQMLRSTGLVVGPAAPDIAAVRAASQRAHALTGQLEFLLQAAWSALRMGDVAGARDLLEREPAEAVRDVRYFELCALVAAELGDAQRLARAEARLGGADEVAQMTVAELAVRALRMVHRVRVARQSAALAIEPDDQRVRLERAARLVAGVRGDGYLLARTIAAQVPLLQGEPGEALRAFRELEAVTADVGERRALRLHAVLAAVLSGAVADGDREFVRGQAGAAWWLVRYAKVLNDQAPLAGWIAAVDVGRLARDERRQLCAITLGAMVQASTSGDVAGLGVCADAVNTWPTAGWSRARHGDHADLLLVVCSVGERYAQAFVQQGRGEQAGPWRARALRAACVAIERDYPRRAEFDAIRARASTAGR